MGKSKKVKNVPNPFRRYFPLSVIFIILMGLALRLLPWQSVFTDNVVQLKGADAYFFTRQAENIDAGGLPQKDPLLCYPQGFEYDRGAALYPLFIAGLGQFMSLEVATAISSPLFALLFFLVILLLLQELLPGKRLAILTGLAVASFTGIQFISRSYIGFGDRHVLENLLFASGLWLLLRSWNRNSRGWAVAAGVVFLLYSFAWSQASLLLAVVSLGILFHYTFSSELPENFTFNNILALGSPLILGLSFGNIQVTGIALASLLAFLVAHFLRQKVAKPAHRFILLLAFLLLASVFTYMVFPALREQLLYVLSGFITNTSDGPVVSEAQPMFAIYRQMSLLPPNAVTIQLLIFGLALLGHWKLLQEKRYLLVVLGLVLFLLSLQRIRTEYYFVISAAIGSAYIATETRKFAYAIITMAFMFLIMYGASWVNDLRGNISSLAFDSSDYKMAVWMRENLPDPGVMPAGNYEIGAVADYGVLNDWQLGYLYTYLSGRPMLAEPNFCNYLKPVEFYLLKDEEEAYSMLKELGIRYLLVKDMDLNTYYYFLQQTGREAESRAVSATLEGRKYVFVDSGYFQRMATRLYRFSGEEYLPASVYTISLDNQLQRFTSYDEAVSSGASEFYSTDPASSPVPLSALKHFRLLHQENDNRGGVKLFEVLD